MNHVPRHSRDHDHSQDVSYAGADGYGAEFISNKQTHKQTYKHCLASNVPCTKCYSVSSHIIFPVGHRSMTSSFSWNIRSITLMLTKTPPCSFARLPATVEVRRMGWPRGCTVSILSVCHGSWQCVLSQMSQPTALPDAYQQLSLTEPYHSCPL